MKYAHQDVVKPEIAERSQKDIAAVNAYVDGLKGCVITIETIRHGQPRPYADSFYESRIFCHQPNVMTTNAPLLRTITRKQAELIARIFVSDWTDNPQFLDTRLEFLKAEPNPCGLEESKYKHDTEERSSCWRVCVRQPYND